LKKAPELTDKQVGNRVRMRRLMLKISQQELAKMLGITFQQVQKYESGSSSISAGRLLEVAHALDTPIMFFFEGPSPEPSLGGQSRACVDELLGTSHGWPLIKAFSTINNARLRASVIRLVEDIAQDQKRDL
jgi:transcriptional regulator with XRE-family HTH domain